MRQYHISFYFLATGMEGMAHTEDWGYHWAKSKKEAEDKAIQERYPNMSPGDKEFTRGCLNTTEMVNV